MKALIWVASALAVASKQKTQKRETVYLEFKDGILKRHWKAEE